MIIRHGWKAWATRSAIALSSMALLGMTCPGVVVTPVGMQLFEDWDTTAADPDQMRGWTFFLVEEFESFQAGGGNPNGHIRGEFLSWAIPLFGTIDGLVRDYVGNANYQELGIAGIRFDINVVENTTMATAREISLLLTSDPGTPEDTSDDMVAIFVSDTILPLAGSGWQTITLAIPSQSETDPVDWTLQGENADWQTIIRDVDRIKISLGNPSMVFLLDNMTIGIDNFEAFPFVN